MNKTAKNKLPTLPVHLRPGFVPAGSYKSFSTPAQMQGFAEAELDRQHFEKVMTIARRVMERDRELLSRLEDEVPAHLDLGGWWSVF